MLIPLATFGPLTGRALYENATWRWIYGLGAMTGAIATAGCLLFYHPPRRVFRDRTKRQILRELDYAGIFFMRAE